MASKTYGTGDAVSIVGGEWSAPDASLEASLATLEAPDVLQAPGRDPAWQWPPLDLEEDFPLAA